MQSSPETFALKQQYNSTRQELSCALYTQEATSRLIARLFENVVLRDSKSLPLVMFDPFLTVMKKYSSASAVYRVSLLRMPPFLPSRAMSSDIVSSSSISTTTVLNPLLVKSWKSLTS